MNATAYMIQDDITCVRIRTGASATNEQRTPVHFCVLVDTSGSMNHNHKLTNVKKSLHYLLNVLTDNDYVSIITFNSSVAVPVSQTATRQGETELIQQRLQTIHAEGGTNLFAGIMRARECLMTTSTRKQGILLLTDGMANEGEIGTEPILGLVRSLLGEFPGTTMSCVGYGVDHNSGLLRGIATDGNGSYNVVQSLEDVATVFGDILGGLVSCAFQQVTLRVPGSCTQVSHFPLETVENGDSVLRIGDIQDQGDMSVILRGSRTGVELSVSGYDLRESRFITMSVPILSSSSVSDNDILHGKITKLRCDVVNLMEGVQRAITCSALDRTELYTDIERLRSVAESYVNLDDTTRPLVEMLIEELDMCKSMLDSPAQRMYATTQLLSQRTSCIASGRGVRNVSIHCDPDQNPIMSPHATIFSNRLQRAISEGLREQTQSYAFALPGSSAWCSDPLMPPTAPLVRCSRILEESPVQTQNSSESDEIECSDGE